MNPSLARMGFLEMDRAVILHADDVGMCHGANLAFNQLSQGGLISCGSVMVPCPGFAEAAALTCANPDLDLGVHLTLTSEWATYRWGPISTRDPASGLLDEAGAFYHRTPQARAHLDAAAAASELRAQVDAALAAGIDVTHLDAHMGVTFVPELIEVYAGLGLEYRLPVLLPRQVDFYLMALGLGELELPGYAGLVERLEGLGMPMVDWFYMSPGVPVELCADTYSDLVAGLEPGLTYFSLHPNAPGDIESIAGQRAFFRTDEYALLQDAEFMAFVTAQGIHILGMRALRDQMRGV